MTMSQAVYVAVTAGPAGDPVFRSLALDSLPAPDFADVALLRVPAELGEQWRADPARAARAVFTKQMPVGVKVLMGLRQKLVRVIGVSPAPRDIFRVTAVVGPEALIAFDDTHLDFRVGVAVEQGLLRVTTAVRLKGWRGRLYFAPVRQLHPMITRAMMRSAIRRAS